MDPQELANKARTATPVEGLVEEVLKAESVAACNSIDHYTRFRECVLKAFPDASETRIAGSGNWGFSMKPDVIGREFSKYSDVDLLVVEPAVFAAVWEELRIYDRKSYYRVTYAEQEALRRKGQDIYCGFASAKWINNTASKLRWDLLKKLNQLSSFLVGGREVNAFFFKDFTEAVDYYKRGFVLLMNKF